MHLWILIFILFIPNFIFALQVEKLSGSDTGMGVGAKAQALGGAFVALSDDDTAMFWNPAGLLQNKKNSFTLMIDEPDSQISFLGFVFRMKYFAVGFGAINRLTYKGRGRWGENKFAGHLIDLSMVNVQKDFNGEIDSKTFDARVSIAFKTKETSPCTLGVNFIWFKCVTDFLCTGGERLPQQVVKYKSMDIGLIYNIDKNTKLGIMFKNPFEETKPHYLTIGIVKYINNYIFTFDNENIFGRYDANKDEFGRDKKPEFHFVRAGLEKKINDKLVYRGGLIIPITAKTSTLGDLKKNLPNPKFGGSLGVGYKYKDTIYDITLTGNPGKSYIRRRPILSLVLTLKGEF